MEKSFWLKKWENNQIAFHRSETHPALVDYFSELSVAKNGRVFVPLCGKTLDIPWLLEQGYQVAGAELSELAIKQLFEQLQLEPKISHVGQTQHYSASNIDIFVGDIFKVSREMLGPVDAIYDRAALVALPREVRDRYTAHLMEITNAAPQLLVAYTYDQSFMNGPPFSISNEEVKEHYQDSYDLTLAESTMIPSGLKGRCDAETNVWLLQKR